MWFLFWAQNSHYILEVFTAFIAFTSAWIFIDSWVVKKELKTLLRSIGFFVLALAGMAALKLDLLGGREKTTAT